MKERRRLLATEDRRKVSREIPVRARGETWSNETAEKYKVLRHKKESDDLRHRRARANDRHVAAVKREHPLPASERGDYDAPVIDGHFNVGI